MSDDGAAPGRGDPAAGERRSGFEAVRSWLRGFRRSRNGEESLRETLEELIEEGEGGESLGTHEWVLLRNILNLRTLSVEDISVPRADIVAVEERATFEDVLRLVIQEAHSRLPVYRGQLDEIIGMVHIKDLLGMVGQERRFRVAKILREVLFVAPSMRVLDLLQEMREKRVHMALVVDEYGGIDGLVTIEDMIEAIVGKIEDEYDVEVPQIVEGPDGSLIAAGRTPIEAFEQRMGAVLTAEEREADIDTLGGLVFSLAERVPGRGEIIRHPAGLEFEILDADPRSIRRMRITRKAEVAGGGGEAESEPAASTPA